MYIFNVRIIFVDVVVLYDYNLALVELDPSHSSSKEHLNHRLSFQIVEHRLPTVKSALPADLAKIALTALLYA